MEDDMTGTDVRGALSRLTDDSPVLGFTPAGLVEAGRRRRRQRHMFAAGGVALAAAAAVAAAVAVPAVLLAPGPGAARTTQAGSGGAAAGHPAPQSAPQEVPRQGQVPQPTGAKTPSCPVMTSQQWAAHVAFAAKVRNLVPQVTGTWTDALTRSDRMCAGDAPEAVWNISGNRAANSLSASANGAQPHPTPDVYRQWRAANPCIGYPNGVDTCTFTRHGQALVFLTHEKGTPEAPRLSGAPVVRSHGSGESIQVNAVWPDNSGVILTLANQSVTDPAAGAPALTEQQMVDAALQLHD
jgi:hypothetical protein